MAVVQKKKKKNELMPANGNWIAVGYILNTSTKKTVGYMDNLEDYLKIDSYLIQW